MDHKFDLEVQLLFLIEQCTNKDHGHAKET